MKIIKILFTVTLLLIASSCSEKNDPLQKSVFDELTDEEIAQVEENYPEFKKKYNFIHVMVMLSYIKPDSCLREVSYQRMMDFLDYRPDTAAIFPRCREEWNAQYAEMDPNDTLYVSFGKYKNGMIIEDLRSHDSLCCEIFTRASSHVMIGRGGKQ
ncbi:MAG: hypothetical protein MJZ93_06830 [Paludibacteraceae bacterium]|nr:hypothetical protein [Paludibacteraceae bacterium]